MSDASTWAEPVGPVVDYGHISRNLNITLMALACALFIHRVYIRLVTLRNWGADDYVATGALALLLTLGAFEIEAIRRGAGRHLVDVNPADLVVFFRNLPTMQLIYMATTYMVKLSIILFLRRLHQGKAYTRLIWGGAATLTVQTVTLMLVFALQCRPPKALWDKNVPNYTCMSSSNQAKLFYAHAGSGIVIDTFCLLVPLIVVWKLLMFRAMQIRLTFVFSVGLFAIVCGIIRFCVIVTVDMGVDTTFNIRRASVWTDLECYIGFFVSCFPTLSPSFRFLRKVITGQSTTSKTNHGKPANISVSLGTRTGGRSGIISHISAKGSRGDIPMYSVSRIVKDDSNDSQDMIGEHNPKLYNNTEFKVRVEKEVYHDAAKDGYAV